MELLIGIYYAGVMKRFAQALDTAVGSRRGHFNGLKERLYKANELVPKEQRQ